MPGRGSPSATEPLFTAAVQPPLVAVGVVILRVIGVKVKAW